ncbi:hypothetical protein MTO96_013055 [Rhipicephalus appendiculatus]
MQTASSSPIPETWDTTTATLLLAPGRVPAGASTLLIPRGSPPEEGRIAETEGRETASLSPEDKMPERAEE